MDFFFFGGGVSRISILYTVIIYPKMVILVLLRTIISHKPNNNFTIYLDKLFWLQLEIPADSAKMDPSAACWLKQDV